MGDWYRCEKWTKEYKQEFYAKLSAARAHNRPQYLMIQALTLVNTVKKNLVLEADLLLDTLFESYTEHPYFKIDKSSALCLRGDIRILLDDHIGAMSYYKKAVEYEREHHSTITTAYLDFSELVIQHNVNNEYDFVEELLLERLPLTTFPVERYKVYAILSIINKDKNLSLAVKYATLAANERINVTPFPHHPNIGLVTKSDLWLESLMPSH